MKECFQEWPESMFSRKARKHVFWKGQKTGFSDFRKLGG